MVTATMDMSVTMTVTFDNDCDLGSNIGVDCHLYVAGLIVRSQATGPKNKRMFHNSITGFIFILQRRKNMNGTGAYLKQIQ
jgi:hypothetical protein